jgi:hypothetical protein
MLYTHVLRRDLHMICDPKNWDYPKGTLVNLSNKKATQVRKISFDSPPEVSLKETYWALVPMYDYHFTRKKEKRYLKRIRYGNLMKEKEDMLKSLLVLNKKIDEKLKNVTKNL